MADTDKSGLSKESVEAGFERKDVKFRPFVSGMVAVMATVVVTAILAWPFYHFLTKFARRQDPAPSPLVVPGAREFPVTPNLQVNPRGDMDAYRAYEDAKLKEFARDPKTGKIQVPVELAMDQMLQRGFPVRPGGPSDEAKTTHTLKPGDASSGRMMERRDR
jgi:hypothetical protein